MKLITKQINVEEIALRWRYSYYRNSEWYDEERKDIHAKLCAKINDKNVTEQDIADIIGNATWTEMLCQECGTSVEKLAVFGNNDSDDVRVCKKCLERAIVKMKE